MEQCGVTVPALLFVLLFSGSLSLDTHSVQYLLTAITPGTDLPEFTAVGLVDGAQFVYYDSNLIEPVLKTEWEGIINTTDPQYQNEMHRVRKQKNWFTDNRATVMRSFNNTEGNHTLQWMYGCECDDDGTTRGYDQYGFDGEDFFSLNLTTESWTLANDKAVIFIKEWDPARDQAKNWKDYLKTNCIDWLNETLKRKVRPEVSVFQKHSPSPEVVCHATGFFPKAVNITWRKDGQEKIKGVELRETLPNNNQTFQKRSILTVPEELQEHNYTCVVQHSSLEKELVLEVPKGGGAGGGWICAIVGVVLGVLLALGLIAVIVFWKCKKSKASQRERVNVEDIEMLPRESVMENNIRDQSGEMETSAS